MEQMRMHLNCGPQLVVIYQFALRNKFVAVL